MTSTGRCDAVTGSTRFAKLIGVAVLKVSFGQEEVARENTSQVVKICEDTVQICISW